MANTSQPQSQRNSNQSRTTSAVSRHGTITKNKDKLRSDGNATMAANPAAQQDQYGSRHNADHVKKEQRRIGTPGGKSDLAFRESAQDIPPDRGAKNHRAGRRSAPKARRAAKADAKAQAKARS